MDFHLVLFNNHPPFYFKLNPFNIDLNIDQLVIRSIKGQMDLYLILFNNYPPVYFKLNRLNVDLNVDQLVIRSIKGQYV